MRPIDALLNSVDFQEVAPSDHCEGDLYATHHGVLEVEGLPSMRVYRLNDGRAVINADDMHKLFGDLLPPKE